MKKVLWMICLVTTFAFVGKAQTKGTTIRLSGTTWSLLYTTGKQNSRDYVEYAKITFQPGNKCLIDNGVLCTFSVRGTKLEIQSPQNQANDGGVKYVEDKINGNTAVGTATLAMKEVPYWIRLKKLNQLRDNYDEKRIDSLFHGGVRNRR